MPGFSGRSLAIGLLVAAGLAVACPGRADDGFTSLQSSVRYRR